MLDLITLEEYKAYAGINSNTQDNEIQILIPKIGMIIRNYTGRALIDYYNTPKQETSDGDVPYILIQEMPIKEILAVEYSSDFGQTYTSLSQFTDFVYKPDLGAILPTSNSGFPYSLNGFRVTYTGGYSEAPGDLKLAAMDLVTYYRKSDMSVKSTRAPGANTTQIEYILSAVLPAHIRRVLDSYRLDLL